jgi:hypothetical protein
LGNVLAWLTTALPSYVRSFLEGNPPDAAERINKDTWMFSKSSYAAETVTETPPSEARKRGSGGSPRKYDDLSY